MAFFFDGIRVDVEDRAKKPDVAEERRFAEGVGRFSERRKLEQGQPLCRHLTNAQY
jgi:hypothetical protein